MMSLTDKCISMDSHAMGVDIPHEESITTRVQCSNNTPRDGTSISSLSQLSLSDQKDKECSVPKTTVHGR